MNKYLKKVAKNSKLNNPSELVKIAVGQWTPWELQGGPKLGPVLKTREQQRREHEALIATLTEILNKLRREESG